ILPGRNFDHVLERADWDGTVCGSDGVPWTIPRTAGIRPAKAGADHGNSRHHELNGGGSRSRLVSGAQGGGSGTRGSIEAGIMKILRDRLREAYGAMRYNPRRTTLTT